MDEQIFGYGETKWDRYLEEAVCARLYKENYHGVVKYVSQEQGAIYLQPSVVSNSGNKGLHIENNLPLMIPFDGCVVTPIIGGVEELEEFFRNYNTAIGIEEDIRDKFKERKIEEFDFHSMRTKWDVYLGKAVFTKFWGDNNYGVVRGISQEQNAVYLRPSVVYNVAGNRFGIVSSLPTMVPFHGCLAVPLRGIEELETILRYYNSARESIEAKEESKK